MKKVAVVHYMPLEYYPPVINLLNEVGKACMVIEVWSTHNTKQRECYKNSDLQKINRNPFPLENDGSLIRMLKYLYFNWVCFIGLVRFKPDKLLYYETYSAFPVYCYLKLFGSRTTLYIHYHEYESQENYARGMRLVKLYHKLERNFLYKRATWISQTNKDRLELFHKDQPMIIANQLHVVPNYPPSSWHESLKQPSSLDKSVIKTVYVGSLSLKDTYIESYCDWLLQQQGKIKLDIYAYNLHEDTKVYLNNINSPYINFFKQGVDYQTLPELLPHYNIGLILYKGNTPNYIHNAPNKLFEYMACGLEVWVSEVMTGCRPYLNHKERPVVRTVDYTNLNDTLLTDYQNHLNLPFKPSAYHCEAALQPLIKALKQA